MAHAIGTACQPIECCPDISGWFDAARETSRRFFRAARSFRPNLAQRGKGKEKAATHGRPFHKKRPPVPPRDWGRSTAFYAGMRQDRSDGRIAGTDRPGEAPGEWADGLPHGGSRG